VVSAAKQSIHDVLASQAQPITDALHPSKDFNKNRLSETIPQGQKGYKTTVAEYFKADPKLLGIFKQEQLQFEASKSKKSQSSSPAKASVNMELGANDHPALKAS
jgi:hypothetical protein